MTFALGGVSAILVAVLGAWLLHRNGAGPTVGPVDEYAANPASDSIPAQASPGQDTPADQARTEHRADREQLAQLTLRRFIGACNRQEDHEKLCYLASQMTQLLGEAVVAEGSAAEELIPLLDDTLELAFPVLEAHGCYFHLEFSPDLPDCIDIAGSLARQSMLEVLLATAATNPGRHLAVQIVCSDTTLSLAFPADVKLDSPRHLHLPGGHWRDKHCYTLPARTIVGRTPKRSKTALCALIISNQVAERRSLQNRLALLGVDAKTALDTKSPDICFVASEDSPGFKSIEAMLPADVPVVLLRSRSVLTRPGWQQLDGPATQQRLAAAIASLVLPRAERKALRVLIVDDNETNAGLLSRQLSELGHRPLTAAGGDAALDLLDCEAVDLVFMDAQMPGMDGAATTHALRARGYSMPVLGLTAHVTHQEKLQYLAAGMSEVLLKPIRRDDLISLLSRHHYSGQTPAPRPVATDRRPLPIIDIELSLLNANQRPDIAAELLALLIDNLHLDQQAINQAKDLSTRKAAVHKLHGAVRYCGLPRLTAAVEKLEAAIKQDDEEGVRLCLNLLNGEISAIRAWYQTNPNPFADGAARLSALD